VIILVICVFFTLVLSLISLTQWIIFPGTAERIPGSDGFMVDVPSDQRKNIYMNYMTIYKYINLVYVFW